jgi:hypothetical protein
MLPGQAGPAMHDVPSGFVELPLTPQQICPVVQSWGPMHVMDAPMAAVHAVVVMHTADAPPAGIAPMQRVAQQNWPVGHVGHIAATTQAAASPPPLLELPEPLPELLPPELLPPELLLEPPLELPEGESAPPPSLLPELSEEPQPAANRRPTDRERSTGAHFIRSPRAI